MENEEVKNEEEVNTLSSETTTDGVNDEVVETNTVEEIKEINESTSENINTNENISNSDTIDETAESSINDSVETTNVDVNQQQNNENNQFETAQPQFEVAPPQFEEVQRKPQVVRTDSYFDGGLLELIGWRILAFLITGVTLGIAYPWAACMLYNYQFKHTVYNGKRLKFEGTGGDLFVNMFKWLFFTLITCGIYAFFIPVSKTKWVISNLHFEDEDHITGDSYFDGNTFQLIGVNILCNLLTILTFGLLYPFAVCFRLKWINKHAIINRKRLIFKGKSLNLLGKYILWAFLTIITFGIFGLWLDIKLLKWETKNTSIRRVGEKEVTDPLAYLIIIPILLGAVALIIALISSFINQINDKGEDFEFNIKYLNPFYLITYSKENNSKSERYIDTGNSDLCPIDWSFDSKLYACYSNDYNQKQCSANNNYYDGGRCYTQAYGSGESIKEMTERITLVKNGKLSKGKESVAEYKKLKGTTKSNTTKQPSKVVPTSNKTSNSNGDVILLSKNVKYNLNIQAYQCNKCFSNTFLNKIKNAKGYYVTKVNNSTLEYSQIVGLSSPYNSTKYYGVDYTKEINATKASNVGGGGGTALKLTATICKQHHLNCK